MTAPLISTRTSERGVVTIIAPQAARFEIVQQSADGTIKSVAIIEVEDDDGLHVRAIEHPQPQERSPA